MDPYYEQRLRDEVSYLHSLWHQGPPRKPTLQRNPNNNHNPSRHLQVSNPTQFKEKTRARARGKKGKKKASETDPPRVSDVKYTGEKPAVEPSPSASERPTMVPPSAPESRLHSAEEQATIAATQLSNPTNKAEKTRATPRSKRRKRGKKIPPESDPPRVSDVEWTGKTPAETPSASASGWPSLKPPSAQLPSAEEQARFAATQVQQKALKAAQEFFADSDGGGDEDDVLVEDEYEECKFFMNVFTEDGQLRGYYEKNRESGEFCCLVCGGTGKKVGKRFKNCVALVQHSVQIAKTKKKRAHRAYAQVICKVLGWDIDRLPTIVLSLCDPLGRSLAKSSECRGNAGVGMEDLNMLNQNSGTKNVNNSELILKEVSNVGQEEELRNSSAPGTSNVVGGELILKEVSNVGQEELRNSSAPATLNVVGDNVTLCEDNAKVAMEDLDMLNQSLASENVNNGEQILKKVSNVGQEEELHNSSVPGTSNVVGDNLMLCESSLKVDDGGKCMENLDNRALSMVDGKTEGEVNYQEPCKDNGIGNEMTDIQKGIVDVNDLEDNNENQN